MARATTFTCDKCGGTIREDRTYFRVEAGRLRRLCREQVDLCEPCAAAFEAWLGAGDAGPPAAAPTIEGGAIH